MTPGAHRDNISKAERAGRWLGRLWRGLAHQESRLASALVVRGIARPIVMTMVWTVRVVALVCLIYLAIWLAVAVLLVIGAVYVARNVEVPKGTKAPVLREGLLGWGFYDATGHRVDPHFGDEK